MSITIYHNPRCSKSRKTLEILQTRGVEPRIVEYLATPPDADTLLHLKELLGVSLAALLRTGEDAYQAAKDAIPLDDDAALAAWLHGHPQVLQRPIVVNEATGRAIIGRPPENVLDIIE